MSKSKKLLNERTIRRFGGLAGIKPVTTSNFLGEMGLGGAAYERDDEEELGAEEGEDVEMDVEMDVEEEPVEDELAMEEPAAGADAEGLVVSLLDKVKEWATEQGVEMDVEEDGEEELEMGGEEELEMGGEEELEMGGEEETLEEIINNILSEEEEVVEETEEEVVEGTEVLDDEKVIQEITNRVKSRLAKMAKAQRAKQ
jgi:hypothetical protein